MYNLVVMYKPLAELLPISTLTQIYYNCAALKAFGADPGVFDCVQLDH